jgi:hypothetical protein
MRPSNMKRFATPGLDVFHVRGKKAVPLHAMEAFGGGEEV